MTLVLFSGCGTYIGTTSASYLRHINKDPDPNVRFLAYDRLGNRELYKSVEERNAAVETLVAKYSEGKEPIAIRVVILRSLGNLGDKRARDVMIKATGPDNDPNVRAEACRGLGKVGIPDDAPILAHIMTTDTLEDCRIAAIEGIGNLRSTDPRINEMLLDGMEHEDPAIRYASLQSLRKLTGKDLGVEVAAWRRDLFPQPGSAKPEQPKAERPLLSLFKRKDTPATDQLKVDAPVKPNTVDSQVITTKQP
jgi:hypothetical protein